MARLYSPQFKHAMFAAAKAYRHNFFSPVVTDPRDLKNLLSISQLTGNFCRSTCLADQWGARSGACKLTPMI